ncbi:hypothetical protein SAMN05443633_10446 [Chryseobacterium arachidis]|uniref:Lipocalin-like domain-containing protein n=1 Tax=Chryseobacterium arachidis TaxID=1416778 RepID=A0A1M5B5F7_9FLAO|nr:hypothetical protein [Chryseobacterium arachidis]SHF37754.1 hypothetical protein SAMN05443633_10446 [Chryseobacterium arachidis]
MKIFKLLFFGVIVLFLHSCKSAGIVGSWEFIEVYDGVVINNVDTLKLKQNNSKYGTGKLIFNKDHSLISMNSPGSYEQKGDQLMIKYNGAEKPASLKISYVDKDFLLLSSEKEVPATWFYRKIKN